MFQIFHDQPVGKSGPIAEIREVFAVMRFIERGGVDVAPEFTLSSQQGLTAC